MFPALGHGVGLRTRHFPEFLEGRVEVDWVEVITENVLGVGGRPRAVLDRVRRDRPIVLHGVSMGVGSVEPLDRAYLAGLRRLVDELEPALVSDHLCWGRAHGHYGHDLWPIAFTEASLGHLVERVSQVQDVLGRRLLIENVSSYLEYTSSELTEWDFLSELSKRADCGLLLDVNNVYVSARNHGFDAATYLEGIPIERVGQFHLAGHLDRGDLVIDTHEGRVSEPVWALYRHAVRRFGNRACLIEWDEGVPPLAELLAEASRAREVANELERGLTTAEPRA